MKKCNNFVTHAQQYLPYLPCWKKNIYAFLCELGWIKAVLDRFLYSLLSSIWTKKKKYKQNLLDNILHLIVIVQLQTILNLIGASCHTICSNWQQYCRYHDVQQYWQQTVWLLLNNGFPLPGWRFWEDQQIMFWPCVRIWNCGLTTMINCRLPVGLLRI